MTNVDEATRTEQSDSIMKEWKVWVETHKDAIVDEGYPLGKTKHVSKDSITDTKNDMTWCMIVQAESHDAAAALIQSNPHLQTITSSYVELMDANRTEEM
jgi:hypothetical protein